MHVYDMSKSLEQLLLDAVFELNLDAVVLVCICEIW